ncbi:MAG: hypothetical protein AABZ47_02150 [Planctomycetota bacterium]
MSIVAANGGVFQLTTSALNIPCTLKDDDDNTLLPKAPDTSAMAPAYQPAYVVPVYDVGDNNMSVPFVLNVPNGGTVAAQDWDSKSLNSNDFWVAYVLEAFQRAFDRDRDPDTEVVTLGVTANPDGGSLSFIEAIRDGTSNPVVREQNNIVHETGHAVGRSGDEPVTDEASNFNANYLEHIRSAARPLP